MTQNTVIESSVQKQGKSNWGNTVWRLASTYDIIPEWWSPSRDAFLRGYWYQENFLASAIYAIANRNAAFGWELTGINEDVKQAQQMLQFAEFGEGWQQFITKFSIDYLTQDNGAFIEVIRPAKIKIDGKTLPAIKEYYDNDNAEWFAFDNGNRIPLKNKNYSIYDSPLDLPIGIAHLDSGQCRRTGDQEVPVIYTDRDGKQHRLKWWQVLTFNEMPSPIKKMNNVGYSALTRVFRSSHVMQSISLYNDEKISGRFNRAIFLTNADADRVNDAVDQTNQDASNRGLLRYSQPIVIDTLNPEVAPSVATINLAEIPDGFDQNTIQNWYIANLALALGVDYGFLAPLPGKGLGTASQSETAARQAKGKSSRLFMDAVSNALNFKGVLPESAQFKFIERDFEAEEQEEKQRKTRAERYKLYIDTGMVTSTIARQMASDEGDIPQIYIDAMGEDDLTPVVTVDGDENLETEENIEEDITKELHHDHIEVSEKSKNYTHKYLNNLPYEKIKNRQSSLFKNKTILEYIKNVARKAIWKKQAPDIDDETQQALDSYGNDLQDLFDQANTEKITKDEFEEKLSDLVILTLTAFYALEVGKDPKDLDNQDLENIEDEISVNIESVSMISDDIYSGRYKPTKEDPERPLMLITRAILWIGSALFLSYLGKIWNKDNVDKKYIWILNPIKENCKSCLSLNKQVHTAKEWREFGVLPQSSQLICFGKYCGCSLIEVPSSTQTDGNLSRVPLRK